MLIGAYMKRLRQGPVVRPWALLVPALVLLVSLPLLRPLRHPIDYQMSDGEKSRLATVQAIVEQGTLAVDQSERNLRDTGELVRLNDHFYSDQPPMLAAVLAPSYWILHRMGWTMQDNPILVAYLLTLVGATLPVAAVAGIVYRMGRLFELPRKWRTFLAGIVVFASGLISYAVVLNAHAPAAALVVGAAACLIHVGASKRIARSLPYLAVGGACAALAATIDPLAATFLILLVFVVLALRAPIGVRVGGVALYALGAAPVILLHAAMTMPLTGDLLPPSLHPELAGTPLRVPTVNPSDLAADEALADPWASYDAVPASQPSQSWWAAAWRPVAEVGAALLGAHGLFSHFPIVLVAFFGIGKIMHRHWPSSTKALAVATLVSALVVVLSCAWWRSDWTRAMFGARWFIVFLPLLVFWIGAWMRKHHHPAKWALVSVLLGFSVLASLIGATNPVPRGGYRGYTVTAALMDLMRAEAPEIGQPPVLAGGSDKM